MEFGHDDDDDEEKEALSDKIILEEVENNESADSHSKSFDSK